MGIEYESDYFRRLSSINYSQLSMPRIDFSQLSMPKIDFNQLIMPRINYSQLNRTLLDFSQLSMPKIDFSQLSMPKIDFSQLIMPSINYSQLNKTLLDFSQMSKTLGFDNYKDQMLSLTEKVIENKSTFNKIIETVIDRNTERKNEGFTLSTNGTLTMNEILYESSEVTNAFTVLGETLSGENGFEQNVSELFRNYSQQHPVILWILDKIVLVLILGIIVSKVTATPTVIQNYNIHIDSINPQYTINTIVKKARPFLNEQTFVANYKFVSIKSLKVYNSKDSVQYIGELKFGQVVTVLEKRREWELIETFGCKGEYIEGWVRSKYLK